MQSRRRSYLWAVCALLLAACTMPLAQPQPDPQTPMDGPSSPLTGELVVFAAASLTEAFTEIGATFEAEHPDVRVILNFAGSQQLAQQLAQGAPADVLAAANERQMDVAIEAGRIHSSTLHTFVHNRLLVIYPRHNPAQLTSLHDLVRPGLKLVLAAEQVPAGGYTLDFLRKAAASTAYDSTFDDAVLANVVSYEQNVKAVVSKVLLGEADAGIVYSSDVTSAVAEQVGRIEIPNELNTIASYPIAPLADAKNPAAATAFVAVVLLPVGQQILASHGFVPAAKLSPSN